MSGARGRKQTGGGSGCAGAILGMSAQGIVLGRVSEWACGRKGGRTQWDEMNVRGEKHRHSHGVSSVHGGDTGHECPGDRACVYMSGRVGENFRRANMRTLATTTFSLNEASEGKKPVHEGATLHCKTAKRCNNGMGAAWRGRKRCRIGG